MTDVLDRVLTEQDRLSESIRNDEHRPLALGTRDVLRQGDLYIARISKLPAKTRPRASSQLADGDTQGSRHVLSGKASLFDAEPADVSRLISRDYAGVELRDYQIGPVFETAGPVTVEHPEHGNRELTEAGCYAVVYQRSLDGDGREERARD